MAFTNFRGSGRLRRQLIPALAAAILGGVAWVGVGPLLTGDGEDAAPPPSAPPPSAPVAAAPPPPEPPPPPIAYPSLLVVNRDVAEGTMLGIDFVDWREWRDAIADIDRMVVKDVVSRNAVVGAVTRRWLDAGEPITWDALLMPGHPGFISAMLAPHMRAVTVHVDRATTDANIIYPGDRVDVIMVLMADARDGGPASRTVVRDCRVLAVGNTVMEIGRFGRANVLAGGLIEPMPPPAGSNYTLEVSPVEAEQIAVATATGQLTLAMRSINAPPVEAVEVGDDPVRLRHVMPEREAPAAR